MLSIGLSRRRNPFKPNHLTMSINKIDYNFKSHLNFFVYLIVYSKSFVFDHLPLFRYHPVQLPLPSRSIIFDTVHPSVHLPSTQRPPTVHPASIPPSILPSIPPYIRPPIRPSILLLIPFPFLYLKFKR